MVPSLLLAALVCAGAVVARDLHLGTGGFIVIPTHSGIWANTSSRGLSTTSVVYTTVVSTVTECSSDCSVITRTIPLYTTVCPVTTTRKTLTDVVTSVYTVTSCSPEVVECPYGKVTTRYSTTTYCPDRDGRPTSTLTDNPTDVPDEPGCSGRGCDDLDKEPRCSGHGCDSDTATVTNTFTDFLSITSVTNTFTDFLSITCTGQDCPPATVTNPTNLETMPTIIPTDPPCNGSNCPEPIVSAGAGKTGVSMAVIIGALLLVL